MGDRLTLHFLRDAPKKMAGYIDAEILADFLIGGIAGMGASIITNPLDVVCTRMQLQGELGKREKIYRNVPHAIYTIFKKDGIVGLQSGLVPAVLFQMITNSVRLGIYQQADRAGLLRNEANITKFGNSLAVGAILGASSAALGSPLLLVRTQLMASSDKSIAVGTQHDHRGSFSALKHVYREGGVKGLWRGTVGMALRNAVSSSTQIASFSVCKDLMDKSWFKHSNKYLSAFFASNIAAVAKSVTTTPFDVVVTRLYNQPVDKLGKGVLYQGIADCARKIAANEGLLAFYKGLFPYYFRQAPQSVLLLMFWDALKDLQKSLMGKIDEKR